MNMNPHLKGMSKRLAEVVAADLFKQVTHLKGTAKIDNWRAFPSKNAPLFLTGTVSFHGRQKEFLSSTQQTSHIVKYDFAAGWVETQNTIYRLGKERLK